MRQPSHSQAVSGPLPLESVVCLTNVTYERSISGLIWVFAGASSKTAVILYVLLRFNSSVLPITLTPPNILRADVLESAAVNGSFNAVVLSPAIKG